MTSSRVFVTRPYRSATAFGDHSTRIVSRSFPALKPRAYFVVGNDLASVSCGSTTLYLLLKPLVISDQVVTGFIYQLVGTPVRTPG